MRTIDAQNEPAAYAEWRARYHTDINYGYGLIDSEMHKVIREALISDQRGLCAYTGIPIDGSHSHIEHLIPQKHCAKGVEDVAYSNMVACYPEPGHAYVPFGAVRKDKWPSPAEQHLFVSPRSVGCEARFLFNLKGEIDVVSDDNAAAETVIQLGLNHKRLEGYRKEAIDATIQRRGRGIPLLNLGDARKRLATLEDAEKQGGKLEPFCFVLKQALCKHIRRLEGIIESKKVKKQQKKRQ